jgi:hypothetical protein
MSEIIKPCGRIVYSGRTIYETMSIHNFDHTTYVVSICAKYIYYDGIIPNIEIYNNDDRFYSALCEFEAYKIEYLEYYVREHDSYRYKLYLIIRRLIKYLTRAEVARLAIASGKYAYNLIIEYADERRYDWNLGGSKI